MAAVDPLEVYLKAAEAKLGVEIQSPEAAATMFKALRMQHKDPAKLRAKVDACLKANQVELPTEADVEVELERLRSTRVEPEAAPAAEPEAPAAPVEPEPRKAEARSRPRERFWASNRIFDPELALDDKARLVFLNLCRHAGVEDIAFPGSRTIARECAIHLSRDVRPSIAQLVASNLVAVEPGGNGHPNGYRILPPTEWKYLLPETTPYPTVATVAYPTVATVRTVATP